jgi:hypothetical protein
MSLFSQAKKAWVLVLQFISGKSNPAKGSFTIHLDLEAL